MLLKGPAMDYSACWLQLEGLDHASVMPKSTEPEATVVTAAEIPRKSWTSW